MGWWAPGTERKREPRKPALPSGAFAHEDTARGKANAKGKRQRSDSGDEPPAASPEAEAGEVPTKRDETNTGSEADTTEEQASKRHHIEGADSHSGIGGWIRAPKKREGGVQGKEGGEASYTCKVCQEDLEPVAFNAKKLNGVRRGWTSPLDLACKACNLRTSELNAQKVKHGGPLARAKMAEKAQAAKRRNKKSKGKATAAKEKAYE